MGDAREYRSVMDQRDRIVGIDCSFGVSTDYVPNVYPTIETFDELRGQKEYALSVFRLRNRNVLSQSDECFPKWRF